MLVTVPGNTPGAPDIRHGVTFVDIVNALKRRENQHIIIFLRHSDLAMGRGLFAYRLSLVPDAAAVKPG